MGLGLNVMTSLAGLMDSSPSVRPLLPADPARDHEGVPGVHEQPDEDGPPGGQHGAVHGRPRPPAAGRHGHGRGGHPAAAVPPPHPTGEGGEVHRGAGADSDSARNGFEWNSVELSGTW